MIVAAVFLVGCSTIQPQIAKDTIIPPQVEETCIAKSTEAQMWELRDWLINKPSDSYDVVLQEGQGWQFRSRQVDREQNLTPHDHFKWRWDERAMAIVMMDIPNETQVSAELIFTVKEYQDLTTADSREYVLWKLVDYEGDGIVDLWSRSFFIWFSCDDDESNRIFQLIDPIYPLGFLDANWYNPSKQEAQDYLDNLVEWWLEQMKIVQQGV